MVGAASRVETRTLAPVVTVRGISKRFGGTQALHDVSVAVRAGEIHALLGENGAGKSTLIKILAGVHAPDEGLVEGVYGPLSRGTPLRGVAFVHQDLGLVDTLSVAENVALAAGFAQTGPLVRWGATRRAAQRALAALSLDYDPETPVGRLGAADKSMLAIARALAVDARVIVLDEPTATLPEADVKRLHEALRALANKGLGIVYVTHRLDEVFALADVVTVLRDGRVCHAGPVAQTDPNHLVEAIIGRRLEAMFPERTAKSGDPLLVVEELASERVGPASFTLHDGEILGLVGLRSGGQDTVGRMLAGVVPAVSGGARLAGVPLDLRDPRRAIASGVGFVSAKRVEDNLCPRLSLTENLHLEPRRVGLRLVNTRGEERLAETTLRRFGVRPPEPQRIMATLSGGNQQKVVIARWLEVGLRVLVLEEPTTGVDVGSRAEIYALLAEAVRAGLSVIVVSSDFEEVAGLTDRAIVFDRGEVRGILQGEAITLARLTHLAGGGA